MNREWLECRQHRDGKPPYIAAGGDFRGVTAFLDRQESCSRSDETC